MLLDSLLAYPERNNLSGLLVPIQFGGVCQPGGLLAAWQWGGFAPCEAFWWRVAGVSEAWMAQFPRLVAVWPPNCRPIGRITLTTGCCGAMGLHFGGMGGRQCVR